MKLLDKIVELVEARGWKEGAFESMAGLPQGRISKWKQGGKGKGPSAREALVMARILEVSLEWLADDSVELPPKSQVSLEEDERIILFVYRDLRDDFGLTAEVARRSLMRAAGLTTPTQKAREDMRTRPGQAPTPPDDDDLPEAGFVNLEAPAAARGTRRVKRSG